jgi:Mg-chelatase subunit ChlD
MKTPLQTQLIALSLFGLTGAAVLYYPVLRPAESAPPVTPVIPLVEPDSVALPDTRQHPVIEAVFVLDTTGSMGGLIQAAKDKIWSIAATMAAAQPAPEIRLGLVAYRDRGDDYVTRVVDLTKDLDGLHAELMQLQAQGGGDGPESVNQALHEALNRIGWSRDQGVYRVIFLVGDAPAHMDYPNDVPYPQTLAEAQRRGIRVNAIQCGTLTETTREWQRIAQLGNGGYFQVEQSGGAVAIATPYDESLAKLSSELDETRIYYGRAEERAKKEEKLAATKATQAAAAPAVLARRAGFSVVDRPNGLFAGVEAILAHEAGDDLGDDRHHMAGLVARLHPGLGQPVEDMDGRRRPVTEARQHTFAAAPIQITGAEAETGIVPADTGRIGIEPVFVTQRHVVQDSAHPPFALLALLAGDLSLEAFVVVVHGSPRFTRTLLCANQKASRVPVWRFRSASTPGSGPIVATPTRDLVSGYRQIRAFQDPSQDETGMHARHAFQTCDLVQQKILIGVHVAHHHLELIVGFPSCDEQAFEHFRHILDGRVEALEALGRVAVHGDAQDHHETQVEFLRIEFGVIAGDESGFFQRAHAPQTGRGRESDAFGQILVAEASVALQFDEDLAVVAVEFHAHVSMTAFGLSGFDRRVSGFIRAKHFGRILRKKPILCHLRNRMPVGLR